MNNNLLIQKYNLYNTQPYEHSAVQRERKNSETLRSFQFSRGPNFKKKARWLKSTWNIFCETPTWSINTQFHYVKT